MGNIVRQLIHHARLVDILYPVTFFIASIAHIAWGWRMIWYIDRLLRAKSNLLSLCQTLLRLLPVLRLVRKERRFSIRLRRCTGRCTYDGVGLFREGPSGRAAGKISRCVAFSFRTGPSRCLDCARTWNKELAVQLVCARSCPRTRKYLLCHLSILLRLTRLEERNRRSYLVRLSL